jgi:hypothetical protein
MNGFIKTIIVIAFSIDQVTREGKSQLSAKKAHASALSRMKLNICMSFKIPWTMIKVFCPNVFNVKNHIGQNTCFPLAEQSIIGHNISMRQINYFLLTQTDYLLVSNLKRIIAIHVELK